MTFTFDNQIIKLTCHINFNHANWIYRPVKINAKGIKTIGYKYPNKLSKKTELIIIMKSGSELFYLGSIENILTISK
tara:strand:- start:294 stop:524 length:231 start_codon:yes stop_codon:yes gene_type:complete